MNLVFHISEEDSEIVLKLVNLNWTRKRAISYDTSQYPYSIGGIAELFFNYFFAFFAKKRWFPLLRKTIAFWTRFFVKNFFDEFLELLFSPFTKNFASVVNKGIKNILYQTLWYERSYQFNFDEFFFLKKSAR